MKKLLALVFAAIMIVLCSGCSDTAEIERLRQENQELKDRLSAYENTNSSSAESNLESNNSEQTNLTKDEIQSSILLVNHLGCSKPNSAGGVDVEIKFRNKSDKTIKYITFSVVAYNAVNDIVSSDIGGKTIMRLKLTGPITPGDSSSGNWENVWYNYTIKTVVFSKIEIEYMDGDTITLNETEAHYSRNLFAPPAGVK